MSFETISVIGLGYIGLPTAAMFASRKKKVIGVDVNPKIVDTVNRGEIHIVEPDLDLIVRSAVKDGYFKAVVSPEPADAFLIAVPTPFEDGFEEVPQPDLRYVEQAAQAISPVLKKGDLVILESTCPVGTTEQLVNWLSTSRPDLSFPNNGENGSDISVAYCPERVLPGQVVRELVENDRVIGGVSNICSERAVTLYKVFVEGSCVCTTARTAEMAKLTENACRDVQIAFANELSIICEDLNINVWELISLANRHPRINILQPGPGVGGHCISVDPWFIVNKTPDLAGLIKKARLVNLSKTEWVVKQVQKSVDDLIERNPKKSRQSITIAFLGLTFKANIDDLRESPAIEIAKTIARSHSGKVFAVEPNVDVLDFEAEFELCELTEAITNSDIIVTLVDHSEFLMLDKPAGKVVIDTKGIWKN